MDFQRANRVAVAAAYKGAKILRSHIGRISQIEKKGIVNLVTQADIESERAIIDEIQKVFPKHGIWAEESGRNSGGSPYQWIIDPLDGTTNFTHGLPLFAISIALYANGAPLVAVVLNPMNAELFSAVSGQGATLNGRAIRVSQTQSMIDSLLVTGFPYDKRERLGTLIPRFAHCLGAAQGVRRLGSAALDLCYVACGRFDGYWEQGLHPWDMAAGNLLVQEAGGTVSDFSGRDFKVTGEEILATNGRVHHHLYKLLSLEDIE